MKFIQPSHELWYPTEPLKDIERAARISYASEGQITETSAKPLVDKLFVREHMTPFEFVTFSFKIKDINLMYKIVYINQTSKVQGDLMVSFDQLNIKELYATCNLRTILTIAKYEPSIACFVCVKYPELHDYFRQNVFEYNNYIEEVDINDIPFDLQYQTVKFITNRGVSHELVRHRKAGFVQSSTRYIGYEKEQFNGELPIVSNQGFVNNELEFAGFSLYNDILLSCQEVYKDFRKEGKSPGEARAILPNDTMTEIVMIARHWSWKHFFKLRTASGAHPDMVTLVKPCYEEFKSKWPEYYD